MNSANKGADRLALVVPKSGVVPLVRSRSSAALEIWAALADAVHDSGRYRAIARKYPQAPEAIALAMAWDCERILRAMEQQGGKSYSCAVEMGGSREEIMASLWLSSTPPGPLVITPPNALTAVLATCYGGSNLFHPLLLTRTA